MPQSFDKLAKAWNLKSTLQKVKDTRNFTVDKTGRFSARFFQIALACFSWYFLSSQDAKIAEKYNIKSITDAMWFFAVTSPIVSIFLVVVYITPWFSHAWTSRRILFVETFCDFFMSLGWLAGFISLVAVVQGKCVPTPGSDNNCVIFNWLVSWLFFSWLAFLAGLFFDGYSLYKGIWAPNDIESEILLDVRRTTRLHK